MRTRSDFLNWNISHRETINIPQRLGLLRRKLKSEHPGDLTGRVPGLGQITW